MLSNVCLSDMIPWVRDGKHHAFAQVKNNLPAPFAQNARIQSSSA
jgi:hypothetical protein